MVSNIGRGIIVDHIGIVPESHYSSLREFVWKEVLQPHDVCLALLFVSPARPTLSIQAMDSYNALYNND
jgi:hypothetical protein